jgi:hypothetical protein
MVVTTILHRLLVFMEYSGLLVNKIADKYTVALLSETISAEIIAKPLCLVD